MGEGVAGRDPHEVETLFRRIVEGLPDEAGLFGSGSLDDTILAVLASRAHPLPAGLLPRWAVVPAVIAALLDLDYRDPLERDRLVRALRRHEPSFGGLLRVEDYGEPGPWAHDLGIHILPGTVHSMVSLVTGGCEGWLAVQLAVPGTSPCWYGRQPGRGDRAFAAAAVETAEFIRRYGDD